MKKLLALLLLAALLLSMTGCALLYDAEDPEFVARSSDVPGTDATNPQDDPGDDETDADPNEEPGSDSAIQDDGVIGGYYYCDDYKFPMPSKWLGAIEVVITEKSVSSGKYTVIVRTYYYVQLDGVRAAMMTIASVPYAYARYYSGSTLLCYSQDKTMAYMQHNKIASLPANFTDVKIYSDIFEELGKSTFKLTPLY